MTRTEEIRTYQKAYNESHREQKRYYAKTYRATHPDRIRAARKIYYETYKEKIKSKYEAHSEQRKIYMKIYAETNREHLRNNEYKRKFGITLSLYNEILLSQNGRCLICGKEPNGKLLAIDHDHITGKVRGLLCVNCNTAIGLFKDDPILLIKAVNYIKGEENK